MVRRRSGSFSGSIWDPPRSHVDREYAERREAVFRALRDIEDRRRFHPDKPFVPAATLEGRTARRIVERAVGGLVSSKVPTSKMVAARIGFAVPEEVAVCLRRKQRREVIHAKRLAKSGSGAKHRVRNWLSDIVCR